MVQKINPHLAPGCNRSPPPPTMYFQKMQFLGVFRPFLQRSLLQLTFEFLHYFLRAKKRSMAATAIHTYICNFQQQCNHCHQMHPDRGKTVWLFYASSFCDFSLTFLRFFSGSNRLEGRPLLYCLWALQPPNLVLILQHTGFKIISEGVNILILKPFKCKLMYNPNFVFMH